MRAAIVLAAGRSTRFGRADKLRAEISGRPLVDHAIDRALSSGARHVVIVTGKRDSRLRRRERRTRLVRAHDAHAGLAASLRAGLAALRPIDREAWIFLGDMPFARAPCRMRLRAGEAAARPIVNGLPGHPMLIRTRQARAALGSGDRGLAAAFPPGMIRTWRGGAGNLLDIDDQFALRRARRARR